MPVSLPPSVVMYISHKSGIDDFSGRVADNKSLELVAMVSGYESGLDLIEPSSMDKIASEYEEL
eukprot:IDg11281t1